MPHRIQRLLIFPTQLFLIPLLLLVAIDTRAQTRTNVALSSNGGVASASSTLDSGRAASAANNGDRKGLHWGSDPATGSGWHCATNAAYPDWLQIDFNGSKTIDEISVVTLQDNYGNPVEPTETMTFGTYGVTTFELRYWTGSAWSTIPGTITTGNNKVWRKFTFTPITTSKIQIWVTGALFSYSRIVELEAWTVPQPPPDTNVALAANGATATASSSLDSGRLPSATINGDRKGIHWGSDPATGSGWHCATNGVYPDSLQVEFAGPRTIDQIDVFSVQDGFGSPIEPTASMTFSLYGITNFQVQYWTGSAWIDVPGGSVSGNNFVWRKFNFSPITTSKIQVVVNSTPPGAYSYSRIVEIEAWTPSTAVDSTSARLDPMNRTGGAGEDPLSRNFNWSVPLVSLPGRGLNLDLSLAYNSLVWTRTGSTISFNDDAGFPSPGFRLGFPVIQPLYFNTEVGKQAFLLIAPDGSRTELRQVGTSALYEAADSSYLLWDSQAMVLKTTEGLHLSFEWKGNDYQVTKIRDANGNFITVNYTTFGRIDTVVDTASRSIKFNYNGSNSLTSISQQWTVNGAPQTHTWATFTYSDLTISTNFTGLTILGPANGSSLKVLTRVTLDNGSRFDLDYTSWGQIWKVRKHAADGHLLNYRSYNLPLTNATPQSDCPRFTERRDWAENWNRNGPLGPAQLPTGPEQEVVTTYAVPISTSWTMPDNTQQTGMRAQVTSPDGTYDRMYFRGAAGGSFGWHRGLTSLVETYDSGNVRQRQIAQTWTQDNTNLSYPANPRIAETNVYDPAGNRARTRVTYQSVSLPDGTTCNLPQDFFEYQGDASTVLRRTRTDYNLSTTYTSRRIIGLASEKQLYEVDPNTLAETLMSKVSFHYDEAGSIQGNDAPVQHDNTNFSSSFLAGRANLSSVKRFDVTNTSQFTSSSFKYNTAGATVASINALGHQVTLSYSDSFSDGVNRNCLAYPTTITDADGFSSTSKYNFDFGAITRTQGPPPEGQAVGRVQRVLYNPDRTVSQVTLELGSNPDYSHVRFEYSSSHTRIDTYRTIEAGQPEAHSFEIRDGHGRTFARAMDHPGSVAGFSGILAVFDKLGRTIKTSNPTETSASGLPSQWAAAGSDASVGWLFTARSFDWKGRVLVTTNPDGTSKEASFSGCGCAGGEVATLTDEGTLVGNLLKKRQKRVYYDAASRPIKIEVLNWDGPGPYGTGGSVYSTTRSTYNARDQITQVRQYQGAESSGIFQETTLSYDGFARLRTKHLPEQQIDPTNSSSTDHTTWEYYADDSIQKITDARGASANFNRNNRRLVTSVTFSAPSGIAPTAPLSFSYDPAGNRISMTDGSGSMTYNYDSLSRLTSETRQFTGLAGNYTIAYEYNLVGALKSISDPTGATIEYARDVTGRLSAVTGSPYGGVTTYASNIQRRAWGGLKHLDFGNSKTLDVSYGTRLQPTSFNIPGVISKTYQYNGDGSLRFSSDAIDHRFDRLYEFDHTARLKEALSGAEARGEAPTNDRPYKQTFSFDGFGHLINQTTEHWSESYSNSDTFVNNRRTGWNYDADGNLLSNPDTTYTLDASGNISAVQSESNLTRGLDGDGRQVKSVESGFDEVTQSNYSITIYYLRSTVLGGQVLTELASNGAKGRTFVYAAGAVLAWQEGGGSGRVVWEHRDPSGASFRTSDMTGSTSGLNDDETPAELDPTGADSGLINPYDGPLPYSEPDETSLLPYPSFSDPRNPRQRYAWNGISMPMDDYFQIMDLSFHGELGFLLGAAVASDWNWEASRVWVNNRYGLRPLLPSNPFSGFNDEDVLSTNTLARGGHWENRPLIDRFWTLSQVNWPGQPTDQQREKSDNVPRGSFPCPPTGERLVSNPLIDQFFQELNRYSRSGNRGFVEAGGWVLMDRQGELFYFIKPREERDHSIGVHGLGEPHKYIPNYGSGDAIVVADSHTHVNELSNPDEVNLANNRGVPGIWVYPSGKAEAYGPNRGLLGKKLPRNCK